jgi:transposase
MPAYSLDLRTRVVTAYRQPGAKQAAVAVLFGVSVSFKKLLAHEHQTGSLVAKVASGSRARYLDAAAQA